MLRTAERSGIWKPFRIVATLASDPLEAWTTVYDHILTERDRRNGRAFEHVPTDLYRADVDWERRYHEMLGCPWPCDAISEFWRTYRSVVSEVEAKGIKVGPETFKGNNDGDAGLVRAIWCFIRHRRPLAVVETGVAHGMTTRLILEAMELNRKGRLWSIDRPPHERALRAEIGIAVSHRFRDRWSLICGASRRHLPRLLLQLGQVDLFIHDSLHTEQNVRFELDHVWPILRAGGTVVVDDIDANWGFRSFRETFSGHASLVCEAEPARPDLRRFNNKGLFGILVKDPQMSAHGAPNQLVNG